MAWKVKGSGSAEFRGPHSCRVEFQVENTATGKIKRERKTFSVNAHTKKEKERCKREFRAELETGLDRDQRTTTFGEYAERWLAHRKADPSIAPRTYAGDCYQVKTINLTFADMRLSAITRLDVKEFQLGLTAPDETGRAKTLRGKPISGTTACGIRKKLKMILQEAVRDGIIAKNPCEDLKGPSKDTEEKEPLTRLQVAQFKAIFDAAEPTPLLVAMRIALFAGLRRGEVCALRWNDISMDERTITVAHSLCGETLELKSTKTEAGERIVPLDDRTFDYLMAYKGIQATELAARELPVETAHVTAEPGEPFMRPNDMTNWVIKFCNKNGFQGCTPHLLRHTYCTLLFAANVDLKTVQYLMGHKNPQTTLGIYTHYLKSNGVKAASAITALMDSLPDPKAEALPQPATDVAVKMGATMAAGMATVMPIATSVAMAADPATEGAITPMATGTAAAAGAATPPTFNSSIEAFRRAPASTTAQPSITVGDTAPPQSPKKLRKAV